MSQSANSLYRVYKKEGGELSFSEWIGRARPEWVNVTGTGFVPENKKLTDTLNKTLSQIRGTGNIQDKLQNKYIFGIDKNLLVIAGVTVLIIGGIIIYKKTSSK